jgi:Xaa-Pro aminopeptidase
VDRKQEHELKVTRVRRFLADEGLAGALFLSYGGFAWITCGGENHVNVGSDAGVAALVVTADDVRLFADNIELRRVQEEELIGLDLPDREYPWWYGSLMAAVRAQAPGGEVVADEPLPGFRQFTSAELISLRNPLLPVEIERYRDLGEQVGVVLTHVAFHCRPALSEHQLAGMLDKGLKDFGITPLVTLVATDERIETRRHPLPTAKALQKHAMLVISARRRGLCLSATRLVHFGEPDPELHRRHQACATVDAAFHHATRPGATLSKVFRAAQDAYAAVGFPDEWQLHHQGGPTGYAPRDAKAAPDCEGAVLLHQAYAWNPSIAGTKSEDTLLVLERGVEVLSRTPDLPSLTVEWGGEFYDRPDILVR